LGSPEALNSDATDKTGNYSPKRRSHAVIDWLIAELADRQHGVVATWQLVALGLTHDDIRYRAKIGRLHRIYRGVYAVGHRNLSPKGHRMAAVLACGADAVLSHRSAAAHWGIGYPSYKIDVTTPRDSRSRKTIRPHTAVLHEEDRTIHDGIPITSVARTILDLAARTNQDGLTYLIEEADRKDRLDLAALDRAIGRRPRVAGVVALRAVLATYRGPADTRSHLERGFRKLIANAGLPEPQFNVLVAGLTVDVYWPQWRLVVELDSGLYHDTPRAFETDRIRDAILQKAGVRVLRVTDERFDHDANGVLADIIALARA
jgi:very-short-patch-repair endonuclease/predicted transcriptional regulator of viral defense system